MNACCQRAARSKLRSEASAAPDLKRGCLGELIRGRGATVDLSPAPISAPRSPITTHALRTTCRLDSMDLRENCATAWKVEHVFNDGSPVYREKPTPSVPSRSTRTFYIFSPRIASRARKKESRPCILQGRLSNTPPGYSRKSNLKLSARITYAGQEP